MSSWLQKMNNRKDVWEDSKNSVTAAASYAFPIYLTASTVEPILSFTWPETVTALQPGRFSQ